MKIFYFHDIFVLERKRTVQNSDSFPGGSRLFVVSTILSKTKVFVRIVISAKNMYDLCIGQVNISIVVLIAVIVQYVILQVMMMLFKLQVKTYVISRGWVRLGLMVDEVRANRENLWKT